MIIISFGNSDNCKHICYFTSVMTIMFKVFFYVGLFTEISPSFYTRVLDVWHGIPELSLSLIH